MSEVPAPGELKLEDDGFKLDFRAWALIVVTLALFGVTYLMIPPSPPRRFRIATGTKSGAYYRNAQRYRVILAELGFQLELVETKGSIENLDLLHAGAVEMAFVQGGVTSEKDAETLEGLASLYLEPLWVFHRRDFEPETLGDFAGKRLAFGPVGSGSRAIATLLLKHNEVNFAAIADSPLGGEEAVAALKSGLIDAAFMVTTPDAPAVQAALSAPDIALFDFRRRVAYRQRNPFLTSVLLAEGVVNLARNLPPREAHLLAPTANLVARRDLHPALVPLMLRATEKVHSPGGIFEERNQFPNDGTLDLPVNEQSERYFRDGPSLLMRYLPFWLALNLDRLKIMLVPLITLLFPLIKIAPPVYRWRIRSKIYRWYRLLRDVDIQLEFAFLTEDFERHDQTLRLLLHDLRDVSVPLSYMEEFYNLKLHIDLVREKLDKRRADRAQGSTDGASEAPAEGAAARPQG